MPLSDRARTDQRIILATSFGSMGEQLESHSVLSREMMGSKR